MKMVKKILLGTLAVAAVLSLASCGKIEDDKDNIIKKNTPYTYSIDYSNNSGENKRAYESTSQNHAGALVKVTFDNGTNATAGTSKMGVIFDLKESEGKTNFYIIGLAGNNEVPNLYVSKLENIVDIQADNFGASTTAAAGKPKETELLPLAKNVTLPVNSSDGSVSVYVYFKAIYNTGSYKWAILNLTQAQADAINIDTWTIADAPANSVLKDGEITGAFTAVTNESSVPQNKHAVYARVAPNKTLKGSWNYAKTYKEAEEIEE